MRTLVLGAGGIGGYFGGRLAKCGADVTFLVRDARAARLRAEGLLIESPLGDATVPVTTVTRGEVAGGFDLVVLSCKAYDLDDAVAAVRPAVGPGTVVLPLLNGMAHLDRLDDAFGADAVLGGLALIGVTLAPDGRIRHLNRLAALTYGARTPTQDARCRAIEALFAPAGFEQTRSDAILPDMWEKFIFITVAASMTCLMRASVGHILAADDGERLMREMIGECEAVAAASGFAARPKAQEFSRSTLLQRGSPLTASMLRDVLGGGATEADHLPGDMIRRGDALGVATPLLRVAYAHLQAYEAGRATAS